MKIAQKIVNKLINEIYFNIHIILQGQFIKTRWVILGDNQFMSKHTFHRINPSAYLF